MKNMQEFDIIIIGAGAVGCAVARKLASFDVGVLVIEKDSDVAGETSGRNSAVVHAGFNNRPGTLMAELCVEGSNVFEEICRQLDVPFKRTGKLVVATCEEEIPGVEGLYRQGMANGCEGLEMISGRRAKELVPGVKAVKALYSPNTGITNPFLYCVAMAENAAANGVCFRFGEEVKGVHRLQEGYEVVTDRGVYHSKIIVNCAGLGAPAVSAMAGGPKYDMYPCRGEYCILDVDSGGILGMPVYPAPAAGIGGLGVHLTPTIEGNVILGPSAEYIDSDEDYSVTAEVMGELVEQADSLVENVTGLGLIGSYSGIRPKLTPPQTGGYSDFIVQEEEHLPGFINMIGIESPGLTSSWPMACMTAEIISRRMELRQKDGFDPTHRFPPRLRDLDETQRAALIAENPEYGEVICRCRKISKAEIRAAIENPLGVRTMSAIKYRAWATTGRCNGGYCMPKIAGILIGEYGMKPEEILYRDKGSNMFTGEVK